MQINQLAFVLDYVDTSIHDTELLPAYVALIGAVNHAKGGGADSAEVVQQTREKLLELHESIEPGTWGAGQLAILESYNARELIGIPAVARIQAAFVENFMNPKALVADLQALHDETLALAERVTLLLRGLDPVLTELPEGVGEKQPHDDATGEPLEGDIIDGELRPMAVERSRNPLSLIKSRLPLRNNQSTALVRADDVPLATKLIAAAPVVLAAAGKALEVYRTYSEAKQSLAATKPAPKQPQQKVVQTQNSTPNSGYVRYSYSRSVYVYRDGD